MQIPRTVYSHALYFLGLVFLCIGCIFYFQEGEHGFKDMFHFLPSMFSFVAGIFISIFNPGHFGWLSEVDPLIVLFMALTGIFAICGLALLASGKDNAGELVLQTAAASVSFLGGLATGMKRKGMKVVHKRTSKPSLLKSSEPTERDAT